MAQKCMKWTILVHKVNPSRERFYVISDGIAPILLAFAQRLPSGHAVIAVAAGAVQPWYAHPITFLNAVLRAASDRDDHARSFMARDKRWFRLYGPISFDRVKI